MATHHQASDPAFNVSDNTANIALWRLYVLRACYAFIALGLTFNIWPVLWHTTPADSVDETTTWAMLVAMSVMAYLGIRHPLKMLPVLLFEMVWKVIWVTAFWLQLWSGPGAPEAAGETLFACLMGIVITPLAIPWDYVWRQYIATPGARWTKTTSPQ